MGKIADTLSELVRNIVAFIVVIIMVIIGFYSTVFVVVTGAGFAGTSATGDFVVLSAALLVAAAILAGGYSPVSYLGRPIRADQGPTTATDD